MEKSLKELLLRDICARLPYGVKVINTAEKVNEVGELDSIMTSRKYKDKLFVGVTLPDDSIMVGIEMIKPYLRSMSSMTEEEENEYWTELHSKAPDIPIGKEPTFNDVAKEATIVIDWLNKKGFDYRGLIPIGLALEAPDDMYK